MAREKTGTCDWCDVEIKRDDCYEDFGKPQPGTVNVSRGFGIVYREMTLELCAGCREKACEMLEQGPD